MSFRTLSWLRLWMATHSSRVKRIDFSLNITTSIQKSLLWHRLMSFMASSSPKMPFSRQWELTLKYTTVFSTSSPPVRQTRDQVLLNINNYFNYRSNVAILDAKQMTMISIQRYHSQKSFMWEKCLNDICVKQLSNF